MNNKLWIAGRAVEGEAWEILGLYSTRDAAVARCRKVSDFVGPIELDADQPEDTSEWQGLEWPVPYPESATT